MANKELVSYIEFFENIKSYIFENRENNHLNIERLPQTIHCDFELTSQVQPNNPFMTLKSNFASDIFFRNIVINHKKICGSLDNQTQEFLSIL